MDDADHKLTLSVYNVHWGSPIKSFVEFVNKKFEEEKMLGK